MIVLDKYSMLMLVVSGADFTNAVQVW